MSTWNIYHKDGSKLTDVNGEQITVHGLEYSDSWMGECFVTINFKHEVPINFQIGDYIVYRASGLSSTTSRARISRQDLTPTVRASCMTA